MHDEYDNELVTVKYRKKKHITEYIEYLKVKRALINLWLVYHVIGVIESIRILGFGLDVCY